MGAAKGSKARNLEEKVAEKLNLYLTKGSGSVHGDGDVKEAARGGDTHDTVIIECKSTEKERGVISVSKKTWEKHRADARRLGRTPVVVVEDADMQPMVIMRLDDFAKYYNT